MPTLKGRTHWTDAKRPRVISITKQDSKNAVCSDHQNCVIAKAIKRVTHADWVDVGATTVLIKPYNSKRYIRYKLNRKAKEQVKFFDTTGQFAPCFVELSAPCASLQVGHWQERQDNRKRRGGPRGQDFSKRVNKPSR